MHLHDFRAVLEQYQVIFFDGYGVIKNYKGLVPGVDKTLVWLEEQGKEYYVVTNDASRSPHQLAQSYNKLGLYNIRQDHIVSSGMLAKEYLQLKVQHGIVAYLGTENSAHYIEGPGLQTLPVSAINQHNIDQVEALVFLDDEGFDWGRDLNICINLLRHRNIPAIVANTDFAYPVTLNEVSIAIGGVAMMLQHIVEKEFIHFGKPDSQMFMFAYDQIRDRRPISKKDIVMVGDTLFTDILGGNKFGLDTVLVLSGNTQAADAENRIRSTGIVPTYICETAAISGT
jgi:HAD superfamily hydrolase (TIGR01450 family)